MLNSVTPLILRKNLISDACNFVEIQNISVYKLEPKAGAPKDFERRAVLHFFKH